MKTPTGFAHTDDFDGVIRHVWFIEPKGKDISFPRWRFALYYARNYAMTHFEPSQAAADAFIARHADCCFLSYDALV